MLVELLDRPLDSIAPGWFGFYLGIDAAIGDDGVREPAIRCRDCSIPNLYLDSTNVLATLD